MKNIFTLFILSISLCSIAQTNPTDSIQKIQKDSITIKTPVQQPTFWKNIRFGGGLGVGFGNNATTISISPTAVYDFNNNFSLGLGVGYQYSKRGAVRSNIYSLSALSLYNPFRGIQISAEFEQLFANQKYNNQTYKKTIPSLYIGAAYTIGRNVSIGIRYDVLFDKNKSIYDSAFSPIFRVFF